MHRHRTATTYLTVGGRGRAVPSGTICGWRRPIPVKCRSWAKSRAPEWMICTPSRYAVLPATSRSYSAIRSAAPRNGSNAASRSPPVSASVMSSQPSVMNIGSRLKSS
jgi:hypothetical protein